jgi:hypothetical protein
MYTKVPEQIQILNDLNRHFKKTINITKGPNELTKSINLLPYASEDKYNFFDLN